MVRDICRYQEVPQSAAEPWKRPVVPPGIVLTLFLFGDSVRWWLNRMMATSRPLEERLTLFWHRHFATGGQKVFSPGYMMQQNQTLRSHCGGCFEDLLKAMLIDPALVHYLDLSGNSAEQPNENFARELLELFTLGRGAYSEADVKVLARFLIGWKTRVPSMRVEVNGRDELKAPMRFMELQGQYRVDELIHYLAEHPRTRRTLIEKLWREFAGDQKLSAPTYDRLEERWLKSRGHIISVVRCLFEQPDFHGAPEPRLKSPLEFYLSAMAALDRSQATLGHVQRLFQLGEAPFFPPSVKGWPQQTAWITPTALMNRLEWARELTQELAGDHHLLLLMERIPNSWRALAHHGFPTRGAESAFANCPDGKERLTFLLSHPEFQFT